MIFRLKADCTFDAASLSTAFLVLSNHFKDLVITDVPGDQTLKILGGSIDVHKVEGEEADRKTDEAWNEFRDLSIRAGQNNQRLGLINDDLKQQLETLTKQLHDTDEARLSMVRAASESAKEIDASDERERKLLAFFREGINISFEGADWCGADIQEKAVELGLAHWEKYDPDKHSAFGSFESDDDILIINPEFNE